MDDNSYPGREYLTKLSELNISIDILSIGYNSSIDRIEKERTADLWKPMQIEEILKLNNKFKIFKFENLKDINLYSHINAKKYTLGIQGGTGIISENLINCFKHGILNFHPGLLPQYRGCSAPEWQLIENNEIYSTCHFIDSGIDSGDILATKIITTNDFNSYEEFRSSIYPKTALFVKEIIEKIILDINFLKKRRKQNKKDFKYRKFIGEKAIQALKNKFKI